jgi:very-short-patch-repair endonuclease
MGSEKHHSFGRAAWELAGRQHGVLSRRQLVALGLNDQGINHRLVKGRLHRIERGIYAVGRPELTQHGRWMAAVLSCGSGAVLSHRSAAALWGLRLERGDDIKVSVPFTSPRRRPGVRVHRRPQLRATDLTTRDGIPVTKPVRMLIDLAALPDRAGLERAINEADRLGLTDPEALLAALDDYPGQRGVGPLRSMLGERSFRLTDSELERRFLSLVEATGLRMPVSGIRLNGFKVDFFWPDLGLVVETDGLTYHRTPAQQTRDRLRDQAHTVAGLTNLRFTHAQVRFHPASVLKTLSATARGLGAEPRSTPRRRAIGPEP